MDSTGDWEMRLLGFTLRSSLWLWASESTFWGQVSAGVNPQSFTGFGGAVATLASCAWASRGSCLPGSTATLILTEFLGELGAQRYLHCAVTSAGEEQVEICQTCSKWGEISLFLLGVGWGGDFGGKWGDLGAGAGGCRCPWC